VTDLNDKSDQKLRTYFTDFNRSQSHYTGRKTVTVISGHTYYSETVKNKYFCPTACA